MKKTKRAWSHEEDALLIQVVAREGAHNWAVIAQSLEGRKDKQCRERWFNHLCPEVKKGGWTVEEDRIILDSIAEYGTVSRACRCRPAPPRLGSGRVAPRASRAHACASVSPVSRRAVPPARHPPKIYAPRRPVSRRRSRAPRPARCALTSTAATASAASAATATSATARSRSLVPAELVPDREAAPGAHGPRDQEPLLLCHAPPAPAGQLPG
jgi:hypothetical protein